METFLRFYNIYICLPSLYFHWLLTLFGPMAGCNDPPYADLTDPEDAAGERPAGRGWRVRKTEPDKAGVVHRWIPNLPDHTDQVWNTRRFYL